MREEVHECRSGEYRASPFNAQVQCTAGAEQVEINSPHVELVFWRTYLNAKVYTFLIIVNPLNGLIKSAILLALI